VIHVPDEQLTQDVKDFRDFATQSDVQFSHFGKWIIRIEKDIRLHVKVPFSAGNNIYSRRTRSR
jgi:hypothetical protein